MLRASVCCDFCLLNSSCSFIIYLQNQSFIQASVQLGMANIRVASVVPHCTLIFSFQSKASMPLPHVMTPRLLCCCRQPTAPKPAQMRPPPPASGSHPSSAPPAHPPSSKAQTAQPPAAAQRGIQNASAGASNQSAQTALTHKEAQKAKPAHGKGTTGPSKIAAILATCMQAPSSQSHSPLA